MFNIKTDYKLELLSREKMRLLGRSEQVFAKYKNGENVPKVEMVDIVLMHCNVVNNNY